jgi:putative transposase
VRHAGPGALREAFLWSARRKVTKTGTVSLHNNSYEVDHLLAGMVVELLFDPFDLTVIEVRHDGVPVGTAIPQVIARHSHPKARPETPDVAPAPTTGIDYTALIAAEHQAHLAGVHLSFADLAAGKSGHGHDGGQDA